MLALFACGTSDGTVASGNRLRARWEIADGAERLVGWHDTKLGFDCDFDGYLSPNGAHACLPATAVLATGFFSDAACSTVAVVATTPGCDTPLYAMKNDYTCGGAPEIFELGTAVTTLFADNGTAGCTAVTDVTAFAVGAPVDISIFAKATETHDDSGQMWLVSGDGARIPWAGWDGVRPVQPTYMDDGTIRWAPWRVGWVPNYTWVDSACTTPAARMGAPALCPAEAIMLYGTETCGQFGVSFTELGTPIDTVYMNNVGPCASVPVASSDPAWNLGAPIPTSSFLSAGDVAIGTGTVQVHLATMRGVPIRQTSGESGGNAPPRPDRFVDVASGLSCEPSPAPDGKTRCMPRANSLDDWPFADAACTQPVQLTFGSSDCPLATPALVTYTHDYGTLCSPPVVHARPVLGAFSGSQVFSITNGTCTASPIQSPTGWLLGDELPPERFAEVTQRTD
jgi:hypothetical protein